MLQAALPLALYFLANRWKLFFQLAYRPRNLSQIDSGSSFSSLYFPSKPYVSTQEFCPKGSCGCRVSGVFQPRSLIFQVINTLTAGPFGCKKRPIRLTPGMPSLRVMFLLMVSPAKSWVKHPTLRQSTWNLTRSLFTRKMVFHVPWEGMGLYGRLKETIQNWENKRPHDKRVVQFAPIVELRRILPLLGGNMLFGILGCPCF